MSKLSHLVNLDNNDLQARCRRTSTPPAALSSWCRQSASASGPRCVNPCCCFGCVLFSGLSVCCLRHPQLGALCMSHEAVPGNSRSSDGPVPFTESSYLSCDRSCISRPSTSAFWTWSTAWTRALTMSTLRSPSSEPCTISWERQSQRHNSITVQATHQAFTCQTD